MPLDDREQPVPPRDLTALWRWQPCRRLPLRRRKMQMVRLGGKKPRRRMMVLVRLFRKMKLRWLKLQYLCMLRKLKEYYRNLIKDMVEGGATMESYQQRLFMESTFAIPVGFTFSSYPSRHGSDRLRTIYV